MASADIKDFHALPLADKISLIRETAASLTPEERQMEHIQFLLKLLAPLLPLETKGSS